MNRKMTMMAAINAPEFLGGSCFTENKTWHRPRPQKGMTRLSVAKKTGKFGQEQKAEEGFESESTNGLGCKSRRVAFSSKAILSSEKRERLSETFVCQKKALRHLTVLARRIFSAVSHLLGCPSTYRIQNVKYYSSTLLMHVL
jgi:hypothetical protein